MAKITSLYTCHEVIVDENDDFVKAYETNLPHSEEIVEAFCSKWNKDADKFMLGIMNEQAGRNRVKSCYARQYKKNLPETTIAVDIVAKEGMQLRNPMRSELFEFMDAQYSDGWGEGFFGPVNIMTAKDGTRFYVD